MREMDKFDIEPLAELHTWCMDSIDYHTEALSVVLDKRRLCADHPEDRRTKAIAEGSLQKKPRHPRLQLAVGLSAAGQGQQIPSSRQS